VVGDGREVERPFEAHAARAETGLVEGRQLDLVALRIAIGVIGRRADVAYARVEGEAGVDVGFAEEGLAQRVALGAGLARVVDRERAGEGGLLLRARSRRRRRELSRMRP
jgi:hypothetical protein